MLGVLSHWLKAWKSLLEAGFCCVCVCVLYDLQTSQPPLCSILEACEPKLALGEKVCVAILVTKKQRLLRHSMGVCLCKHIYYKEGDIYLPLISLFITA